MMNLLKKTFCLLCCFLIMVIISVVGCCGPQPPGLIPSCNLKVLDSEITLVTIDTLILVGAPRTILIDSGLHIIHGISTRDHCVDGQDVVGTVFGVVNPLSAARVFIQELTGSSSRVTDTWGVGVWIKGNSGEQFEIRAVLVDPIDADLVRSIAKDTTIIHDINDLKITMNERGIYFKDSESIFVKLR